MFPHSAEAIEKLEVRKYSFVFKLQDFSSNFKRNQIITWVLSISSRRIYKLSYHYSLSSLKVTPRHLKTSALTEKVMKSTPMMDVTTPPTKPTTTNRKPSRSRKSIKI